MMFKDIVVPMTDTRGDSDALEVALSLATWQGARLSVLEVLGPPVHMHSARAPLTGIHLGEVWAQIRSQAALRETELQARLAMHDVPHDVRLIETEYAQPWEIATTEAAYADLSVVAGAASEVLDASVVRTFVVTLLLASGRPLLMVPPRCRLPAPPARVLLAWKPCAEATRAMHEAMPLLVAADVVEVVIVADESGESGESSGSDEAPTWSEDAQLVAHLEHHGVRPKITRYAASERSAGATILAHAAKVDAQLLVAGGYGHSRIREWALGGVTRELLARATLPVFLSH